LRRPLIKLEYYREFSIVSAFEQVFRVLSETLNQPTSHMFILVELGYQPR
jgi:hypothetical protein